VGLNSKLDPVELLVGLECGWGLADFDLTGAVSRDIIIGVHTNRTTVWHCHDLITATLF
jgi:hypothetical protein